MNASIRFHTMNLRRFIVHMKGSQVIISKFKDLYSCQIEIINQLTDKGQLQYLNGLKGPQEGTNLYITQFLSLW